MGRHRRYQTRGLPLRVAGAMLLVISAGIHLDLYLTGYRSIPTIGWLFMLQFVGGLTLAIAVLVTHSRLAVAASAAFALSTLSAYLLAVWIGLFGFKEVRTRAGIAAGLIEVAAFATLALAAAAAGPGAGDRRLDQLGGAPGGSRPRGFLGGDRRGGRRSRCWRWRCSAWRWPTRRSGSARARPGAGPA